MAHINTVWDNKPNDIPKDHEMFTSQGPGQSGTGVLRPVKGPNKKKAQDDPDYLNKMMNDQQNANVKSDNKFKDAIYIYKNGFKIGNGPFNDSTNNAENQKFLDELNKGEIPSALEPILKKEFGDNAKDMGVDIVNRKDQIFEPPKPTKPKFQAFTGTGHSMNNNNQQVNMDVSFDNVNPNRIVCNASNPNTRIQIILIGGKKETLKVNLTNTILEIYAHVKAVSGFGGKFKLLAGFPPKPLSNPNSTVAAEKLQGARITQKKL